jgi:Secretion system C-terminal sorting domain
MKNLYFFFTASFLAFSFQALPQGYWRPFQQVFHANNIHTVFWSNGDFGWDGNDAVYQVPYLDEDSPSTLIVSSLWLATEDGPELRVDAQMFANYDFDFYSGPLNPTTGLPYSPDDLQNFNKIWKVSRLAIERHIQDFEGDGTLDNPEFSVVGWPGSGNPYFKLLHGFDLSDQGLAPFFDRDGDGIYNAFQGDYPLPEAVTPGIIPEEIFWMVFNDAARPPQVSNGEPLNVEIQLTAWAFNCEDPSVLNSTLFISRKIINRSGRDYQDLYAGVFTDTDIGCFTDDYIGCNPDLNTYYGYNGQFYDKDPCDVGFSSFPPDFFPPVQAVTLLNQPMTGFQMFNNGYYPLQPPPGTTDPNNDLEFYNYLQSKWKDGTPLTPEGDGYNPGSSLTPVKYAFAGDPSKLSGWSMYEENLLPRDTRGVGITKFNSFKNGEAITIDAAYSTHHKDGLIHVQQVGLLNEEIPLLHQMYDTGFKDACQQPSFCEEDCVWPGDANADGIANHFDLLAIGAGFDSVGPQRQPPHRWFPLDADDWPYILADSTNFKHLDCNGDGVINRADFTITKLNFGMTNENYVEENNYRQSDELFFTVSPKVKNNVIETDVLPFSISVRHRDIPDLAGLAFTVEFDTSFFNGMRLFPDQNLTHCLMYAEHKRTATGGQMIGEVDFAMFNDRAACFPDNERLLTLLVNSQGGLNTPFPTNSTVLRIRNAKALLRNGTFLDIGAQDLHLYFSGLGIEVQEKPVENLIIYPNPSSGVFYVRVNEDELDYYQLYDAAGRLIKIRPEFRENDFLIDLRHLSAGIYFLHMVQGFDSKVYKLMVGAH